MMTVHLVKNSFLQRIQMAIGRGYFHLFMKFAGHGFEQNNEIEIAGVVKTKEELNAQTKEVLHQYGDNILRLAYSYLHNMSDAEDVLQETLIQFIKTEHSFESLNHKKAWLLRVTSNLSKNKIKYNKIRSTDELSENLLAEEKEDLSFVWEAVKELPQNYREVIHLFYQEGYSTAEIAKVLDKNETTIRSLLHRGRSKLKTVLKEVYDFEE